MSTKTGTLHASVRLLIPSDFIALSVALSSKRQHGKITIHSFKQQLAVGGGCSAFVVQTTLLAGRVRGSFMCF